jgi:hypothetical protein
MKSTITGNRIRVFVISLALVVMLAAVPAAFGKYVRPHDLPLNGASNAQSQGRYGPLDPWAYKLIHSPAPTLITEHSAGQDPNRRPILASGDATVTVVRSNGFNWGDAGIGAAAVFGMALALMAAAVLRRRRTFAGASL